MITDPIAIVENLKDRAQRAGVSMATVCKRAGVAQSTFTRWKAGTYEPTMRKLRRMQDVLTEAEAAITDKADLARAEG